MKSRKNTKLDRCITLLACIALIFMFTVPASAETDQSVYERNVEIRSAARTDEAALARYLMPTSEIQCDDPRVVALAEEITAGITSDYEKAKAIHKYVTDNFYYDMQSPELLNGYVSVSKNVDVMIGVCADYAGLTVALLRASGIPAKTVDGYGRVEGEAWPEDPIEFNHGWLEAFVDGRWISIDPTYDSGNAISGDTVLSNGGMYRETYFDISDARLSVTHRILFRDENALINPKGKTYLRSAFNRVALYNDGFAYEMCAGDRDRDLNDSLSINLGKNDTEVYLYKTTYLNGEITGAQGIYSKNPPVIQLKSSGKTCQTCAKAGLKLVDDELTGQYKIVGNVTSKLSKHLKEKKHQISVRDVDGKKYKMDLAVGGKTYMYLMLSPTTCFKPFGSRITDPDGYVIKNTMKSYFDAKTEDITGDYYLYTVTTDGPLYTNNCALADYRKVTDFSWGSADPVLYQGNKRCSYCAEHGITVTRTENDQMNISGEFTSAVKKHFKKAHEIRVKDQSGKTYRFPIQTPTKIGLFFSTKKLATDANGYVKNPNSKSVQNSLTREIELKTGKIKKKYYLYVVERASSNTNLDEFDGKIVKIVPFHQGLSGMQFQHQTSSIYDFENCTSHGLKIQQGTEANQIIISGTVTSKIKKHLKNNHAFFMDCQDASWGAFVS